jgi:hypothetical protein
VEKPGWSLPFFKKKKSMDSGATSNLSMLSGVLRPPDEMSMMQGRYSGVVMYNILVMSTGWVI